VTDPANGNGRALTWRWAAGISASGVVVLLGVVGSLVLGERGTLLEGREKQDAAIAKLTEISGQLRTALAELRIIVEHHGLDVSRLETRFDERLDRLEGSDG